MKSTYITDLLGIFIVHIRKKVKNNLRIIIKIVFASQTLWKGLGNHPRDL
jgi:hypothetical protein